MFYSWGGSLHLQCLSAGPGDTPPIKPPFSIWSATMNTNREKPTTNRALPGEEQAKKRAPSISSPLIRNPRQMCHVVQRENKGYACPLPFFPHTHTHRGVTQIWDVGVCDCLIDPKISLEEMFMPQKGLRRYLTRPIRNIHCLPGKQLQCRFCVVF